MQRNVLVLVGAIVVLAVIAAAVVFMPGVVGATRPSTTLTDQAAIAKTALVFVSNPYKDDYQSMRIPGYVDNRAKTDLKSVTMDVVLYDKDGNRKEIVKYVVENVPAGGRKSFDANAGTIPEARVAKVKVTAIEVFTR